MTIWNSLAWFSYLVGSAYYRQDFFAQHGGMDQTRSLVAALWTGALTGFVVFVTNYLHARRCLLIGLIEPQKDEWSALLDNSPRPSTGLWRTALCACLLLAGTLTGFTALWFWLSGRESLATIEAIILHGVLPGLAALMLALLAIRWSIVRLVVALELNVEKKISVGRYVFLHHMLPLTLFTTLVGLAVGFNRFVPQLVQDQAVDTGVVARHLAFSVLTINFVVALLTRIKTRIDFLSPLVLLGEKKTLAIQWTLWTMLFVPGLVYGVSLASFWLAGLDRLSVFQVLLIKGMVCLFIAAFLSFWAGRTAVGRLAALGLDGHGYVRVHRFLRRNAYLGKK